jgi:hypothetical protein
MTKGWNLYLGVYEWNSNDRTYCLANGVNVTAEEWSDFCSAYRQPIWNVNANERIRIYGRYFRKDSSNA